MSKTSRSARTEMASISTARKPTNRTRSPIVDPLLSLSAAARLAGMTRRALYRLAESGPLVAYRRASGRIEVRESAVLALVAR